MDIDYLNKSSSDSLEMSASSSSEELNVGVNDVEIIKPYAFKSVETGSSDEDSGSEEMVSESSSSSENTRLQDRNW